jgi:site-specific recombinase XerD
MTIQEAIEHYLTQIKRSKSRHTTASYRQGLQAFAACMGQAQINFAEVEVSTLSPAWVEQFLKQLQKQAVPTEQLYTTAVAGFYRYVAAKEWATLNLATLDFEIGQRRSQGRRLPIFPEDQVEALVAQIQRELDEKPPPDKLPAKLAFYRDRALLITLADTGLRVSEACGLRKGDVDWGRKRAVIIGKGDKQALVRFSDRVVTYLKKYLYARLELDRRQGRQDGLPLFARHDKRAGKKVLPMSTRTAENIVTEYVSTILGEEAKGTITPHTFRHFFVTRAAREKNILLAQHLARHETISTTTRYAHLTEIEIDAAYAAIFDNGL